MPKLFLDNKHLSSKKLLVITSTAVAMVALVYVFIAYVVMPLTDNSMRFLIPSKLGSKESYMTLDEFMNIGLIALAIALFFGIAIALLVKYKKMSQAVVLAMILVAGAFFYTCLYVGNGLGDVWGGGWSIVGVALTILLGALLQVPLLLAVDEPYKRARNK